ncbi:MAG: T9SS type A sorting domain-containing protein, partial [Candidatus Cloacimonetes bacterium]|nr:T9SS type A sorting domain-containing protein [Candidatus Cloacimonadota bacterium]
MKKKLIVFSILLLAVSIFATSANLLQYGESNVNREEITKGNPNVLSRDILVEQLPNQVNGLFCDGSYTQVIAENFILSEDTTIEGVVIWGGNYPNNIPMDPDYLTVAFHTDAAGAIGTMISTEEDVPYVKELTGTQLFGVDEWLYTMTLANPVDLTAGTYWIEFYNTTGGPYPTVDTFFWETGDVDPVNGIVGSAWATVAPGSGWNYDTATDLSIQILSGQPLPPAPIENLAVDESTGLLTWDAPSGGGGDLIELVQHDGNPANAYYQDWDSGYGVVYDLSGYTNVTIEMVDFRHSPWGVFGTWDYSIHIVNWDTYTEITEVTGLQTTGDDIWEEGIDLGSISASGLVGIFMEPMGNVAADAYPCIDSDDIGPDGLSYYGPLSDYSAMALSGIGDFLMDLWIMGESTDGVVKAKKYEANFGNGISRVESTIPSFDFITLNQTVSTRDLIGYDVYLDGVLQGDTTDLEYLLEDLVNGDEYLAGVVAVYDEGDSDVVELTFTYTGTEAGNDIVATTMLKGNYPNPFNPVTNIAYSIQDAGNVTIEVYNLRGQLVKTLVNEVKETGDHTAIWDGTDNT